jgi:hypothetical protein
LKTFAAGRDLTEWGLCDWRYQENECSYNTAVLAKGAAEVGAWLKKLFEKIFGAKMSPPPSTTPSPVTSKSFNAEAALKVARGYHSTALVLERIRRKEGVPLTIDMVNESMARVISSTVLEALAMEILLKVRLDKAGIAIPRTHNHSKLFAKLPAAERQQAGQRYQASRHPAMHPTIEEALAYSADVFEVWRYSHEHDRVEASMGEMQRAFHALAHGL